MTTLYDLKLAIIKKEIELEALRMEVRQIEIKHLTLHQESMKNLCKEFGITGSTSANQQQ